MAFQVKANESVPKAVRRAVRKQIDNVLEELEHGTNSDEVVHGVRQRFKKVRAAIRLVRQELGEKVYRQENACFRDAARPLAEVRDAIVLLKALDQLTDSSAGRDAGHALAATRTELEADLESARKQVLDEDNAFAKVRETVEGARSRLKEWTIDHQDWSAIRPGLKSAYKSSRLAFSAARGAPTTDNLHEWRKQAKYLYHQLQFLEPISPEVMKELARQARKITQLLGDDHDLAVLRARLTGDPERFGSNSTLEVMEISLDHRRRELQAEALSMAEHFYSGKPRTFARRIRDYWKAWRKRTKTRPEQARESDVDAGLANSS